MAKKGVTAAELMKQLEADPEYVARRQAKEAQIEKLAAECKADEKGLLAELNEIGINVDSVWDLVNNSPHPVLKTNFMGSYEIAYPILVRHLGILHHKRIREGIIRALSDPDAYEVAAQPLIEQLRIESKKSLRWVIANALKVMLPNVEIQRYPEIQEALDAGYL